LLSAAEIIRLLELKPHPEGGHFRETFRDSRTVDGGRAASTAIYFLLARGERSHWHRVDAVEIWHYHAGAALKLEIVDTTGGGADDDEGTVEFIATYRQKGVTHNHHEVGEFRRHKGCWYYTDGKMVTPGTQRNEGPRTGRNDPCPCGSGKKYKKCCGA